MSFSCLSVSLLQPCDPRLWNGSTLLLPLAHATASPWKQLVRLCLAAGTEDLSSAAPGLHGFGLNKPGRMLGTPSSLAAGGVPGKSPTPSYSGSYQWKGRVLYWLPAPAWTLHLPLASLLSSSPLTHQRLEPLWALQVPPVVTTTVSLWRSFVSLRPSILCIPVASVKAQALIISFWIYCRVLRTGPHSFTFAFLVSNLHTTNTDKMSKNRD